MSNILRFPRTTGEVAEEAAAAVVITLAAITLAETTLVVITLAETTLVATIRVAVPPEDSNLFRVDH